MSLKAFHLVFIVVSIALSAFVAAWGFRQWAAGGGFGALALAVVFLGCGVGLVAYGVHAIRKLRDL